GGGCAIAAGDLEGGRRPLLAGVGRRGGRLERRREQQRERAALPGGRAHADLAAEQAGDLPRDRQPEARAAIAAAGGPVGLLEGLADQPTLVHGTYDAGVAD